MIFKRLIMRLNKFLFIRSLYKKQKQTTLTHTGKNKNYIFPKWITNNNDQYVLYFTVNGRKHQCHKRNNQVYLMKKSFAAAAGSV